MLNYNQHKSNKKNYRPQHFEDMPLEIMRIYNCKTKFIVLLPNAFPLAI